MPFSAEEGKDLLLRTVDNFGGIYKVLDIGPGVGTYSDLLRGKLKEDLALSKRHDPEFFKDFEVSFHAVEAWGPYIERFDLNDKYDEIIVADVRYVDITYLTGYDLVCVGDVIEHLTKPDARSILDWLIRYNQFTWVSFPVLHLDQEPWKGNFFEVHKDHWTAEEFEKFIEDSGFRILDYGKGDILAYYFVTL